MRHFDLDQPHRFRTWPDLRAPLGGAGRAGRPRTAVPRPRGPALAAGCLVDIAVVAAAGWSVPLVMGGPAAQPLVLAAIALANAHGIAALAPPMGWRGSVVAALLTMLMVFAAAHGLAWTGQGGVPPAAPWALLAGALVAAGRPLVGLLMARLVRLALPPRRVLVIGERDRALDALSLIAGDGRAVPVGVCLDRESPAQPALGGFITGLDDAERLIRDDGVDDVVLALPWSDSERMARCLAVLRPLMVEVHLLPEIPEPFIDNRGLSMLAGVPMPVLGARPLSGARAVAKAVEDRVLGGILLLLAAPLMAVIAIAIKLDSPGPVFFRQSRYGYDNQPFTCFKFRSMVVRPPEAEIKQASRDDPRVTRVGRFLRRSSLDELAQLINVVNGTMSLVGPRPHAVSHHHLYAKLVDDYRCRHRMKPGITGWAQVNGYRGETATVELMRKRVIHDLWYIDHWSLGLDLVILARTPLACLKATNAY